MKANLRSSALLLSLLIAASCSQPAPPATWEQKASSIDLGSTWQQVTAVLPPLTNSPYWGSGTLTQGETSSPRAVSCWVAEGVEVTATFGRARRLSRPVAVVHRSQIEFERSVANSAAEPTPNSP